MVARLALPPPPPSVDGAGSKFLTSSVNGQPVSFESTATEPNRSTESDIRICDGSGYNSPRSTGSKTWACSTARGRCMPVWLTTLQLRCGENRGSLRKTCIGNTVFGLICSPDCTKI
ncbi:uncharacterized protein LOC129743676 [Uranotaenia lowii]|uniref:uncharacterized protein LOC129743676 n=1 Tax=Uranotaenia lowii TaxID=190385 RepID=UPI00247A838E|nr:uncharacterized protein LOC129743676 [Uranotaenia lowii]